MIFEVRIHTSCLSLFLFLLFGCLDVVVFVVVVVVVFNCNTDTIYNTKLRTLHYNAYTAYRTLV